MRIFLESNEVWAITRRMQRLDGWFHHLSRVIAWEYDEASASPSLAPLIFRDESIRGLGPAEVVVELIHTNPPFVVSAESEVALEVLRDGEEPAP